MKVTTRSINAIKQLDRKGAIIMWDLIIKNQDQSSTIRVAGPVVSLRAEPSSGGEIRFIVNGECAGKFLRDTLIL